MELPLSFFLQNLLSDISKKEADLNNISKHSQFYQQAIKVSIIWCLSSQTLIYRNKNEACLRSHTFLNFCMT